MVKFLCGYDPATGRGAIAEQDLTKVERKTVRNFAQYLSGVGRRCPACLHKAEKHYPHSAGCQAKHCDCPLGYAQVIKTRQQVKARGWEKD